MPRYKLTIAFDGTNFCGWQKQFPHADSVPTAPKMPEATHLEDDAPSPSDVPPTATASNAFTGLQGRSPCISESTRAESVEDLKARKRVELRTVQSVVERAVRETVREPVELTGASRTDAGVHARGQTAAFTCSDTGGREGGWPESRGLEALTRAINSRLPPDVLVTNAALAPPGFDPIQHATRKAYSYTLWTGRDRPLWERDRVLHIWSPLDVPAMHAAAQILVGEHDFAGFAATGHGRKTTVRTIYACAVRRANPNEVIIEVVGNGFLWNMVRIIAGTLIEIGKGSKPDGSGVTPDRMREALRTGDRLLAGPTAPARGLCLEWIEYNSTT